MRFRRKILTTASEDRLEKLIQERLRPRADKKAIDKRIWDLFGEEWCVMFSDLSGFSRNVEKFGIIHFLQTIHESERLLIPIIDDHDGILLKTEGDSLLVIFRDVDRAIAASVKMQAILRIYNRKKLPEEKVLLCIGLGYGKILRIGDNDAFGAEVNAASKLGEDTAAATEILVTQSVKEKVGRMEGISFEPISEVPPGTKKAYRLLFLPKTR